MKGIKIMNETKIFLNDWNNYNNGFIGYGWMTPAECMEYMEERADQDREWFIADIDNYLGVDFGSLDYANVEDICEQIETLENMEDYERDEVIAVMEYRGCSVEEAIDTKDNYIIYSDEDSYRASLDEYIEYQLNGASDLISSYFDYDAYFASNGCIIVE